MSQQNLTQEFDVTLERIPASGLNKRNAKDIQKMIQKVKDNQDTSVQLQISYEEACE